MGEIKERPKAKSLQQLNIESQMFDEFMEKWNLLVKHICPSMCYGIWDCGRCWFGDMKQLRNKWLKIKGEL